MATMLEDVQHHGDTENSGTVRVSCMIADSMNKLRCMRLTLNHKYQ